MRSPHEAMCEHDLQLQNHVPQSEHVCECESCETQFDGFVVVWTDGACENIQIRHFGRAGCGVFYGSDHSNNLSFKLTDPEQTNQRAEFAACIACIESDKRCLEIRTDSKYVIDGSNCRAGRGDNVDLWSILHSLLDGRGRDRVRFVKVRGHAKEKHIRSSEVSALDKWGNGAADELAVAGARAHAIPDHVRKAAAQRKMHAKATHRMMFRILHARRIMESHLAGECTHDDADEVGEEPWCSQCPMYVPHPCSGEG